MKGKDLNKLKEDAEKIRHKYEDLLKDIASMEGAHAPSESRIRGIISTAAVTAESLLKYIIRNEGREHKLNELKPNERGLFNFKKLVEDIIPEKQKVHIGTIIPWRNIANHHSDHTTISDDELKAVEAAINSLVKWFFEKYLGGEYIDYSKNLYLKKNEEPRKESHTRRKEFEDNRSGIPDEVILKRSGRNGKQKRSVMGVVIIATFAATTAFLLLRNPKTNEAVQTGLKKIKKENRQEIAPPKELSRDSVLLYVQRYADICSGKSNDFQKAFSDKISKFPGIKQPVTFDMVKTTIQINRNLYKNAEYKILENTLSQTDLSNCISTFTVTTELKKKKGKKKKTVNETLEFKFDQKGKVVSVMELL